MLVQWKLPLGQAAVPVGKKGGFLECARGLPHHIHPDRPPHPLTHMHTGSTRKAGVTNAE